MTDRHLSPTRPDTCRRQTDTTTPLYRGVGVGAVVGENMTEPQLLILAANRDAEAFTRLYCAYYPAVAGWAGEMAGRDVADDLAQDLFLRLWSGKHRLVCPTADEHVGGLLRYWLAGLASNHYRHWRRQRRDRSRLTPLEPVLRDSDAGEKPFVRLYDPRPSPEAWALAAEQRRHIAAALLALPAPTRRVARLFYLQDRSGPQIAADLDRSVPWVSWQRRVGRTALQASLEAVA